MEVHLPTWVHDHRRPALVSVNRDLNRSGLSKIVMTCAGSTIGRAGGGQGLMTLRRNLLWLPGVSILVGQAGFEPATT
jgi:hypothetical protein